MSGECKAVVDRVLEATVEEVYDAWTDPAILAEWMSACGRVVKADVRVGGEFSIDMGCEGGAPSPHTGRYLVLERPRRIEFTWVSAWTDGESVVRIALEAQGGRTRFRLEHSPLPDEPNALDHQAGWGEFAEWSAACARRHRRH